MADPAPAPATADQDSAANQPGSFGCHEALHMAHVCAELVGARLCEHPAIANRPEWLQLASAAEESLQALYQAIGAVHLEDPAGEKLPRDEVA